MCSSDLRPPSASDGHDLRTGALQGLLAELVPHLVGHLPGVPQEGLDHLALRDGLHHLARHEDLALAVARGAAQVGLARLAGPVDDAPP